MSCEGNVCGTGGWDGPLPGDPDNDVSLAARTVYSGIAVSWSYPLTNSHAVAHTKLWRGNVNDFSKAVQLGVVGGSLYFDKLDPKQATTYFYWIQIVSINGTTGATIGPVSAEARPLGQQTLESLTGLIDAGQLAIDLKTSISGITLNNAAIIQEIKDRLLANAAFAAALKEVQDGLAESMTFISHEVTERRDGDSALVQAIDILAAANRQAMAAIEEERTVRVGQNEAYSQLLTNLISTVGDNAAGLVHDVNTLATDSRAQAQDIETLVATVGDSNAGLVHDMHVATTQIGSISSDVTTVEASLNGDVATGQIGLITQVGNIDGKIRNLSAEYFVKLEANGLLGGFGLYNDGALVDAGFDVDRFWVGRTNENKVKPFIVSGGVVYIDSARIRTASIDSLHLAGEAVTVPVSVNCVKPAPGKGRNNYYVITEGYFNMTDAGILYALMTGTATFPTGDRWWSLKMRVNGVDTQYIAGTKFNDSPALSCSTGVPAGVSHVEVLWYADNPQTQILASTLFMIGTKK